MIPSRARRWALLLTLILGLSACSDPAPTSPTDAGSHRDDGAFDSGDDPEADPADVTTDATDSADAPDPSDLPDTPPQDTNPDDDADVGPRPLDHTNIIILFIDDLGLGDLGAYGQTHIRTPHIDRMAAEGLRFTQYYTAPWCGPARSALLEGKHLGRTWLRKCLNIPISVEIMPMRFQDAGYATGMFGKWGFATISGGYQLGEPFSITDGAPEFEGFDEFVGFLTHRDGHVHFLDNPAQPGADSPAHPYYDDIRRQLFRTRNGATEAYPIPTDRYIHDEFADQVLDFITRHQGEPFFLYAPFTVPHAELVVPPDRPEENLLGQYLDANGRSIFPETPWRGNPTYKRHQDHPRATYAAMISRLDRDVGRILDLLRELDLDQNTLVLLTSDNGSHRAGGRTSEDVAFFNSTAGFRGYKFDIWEGGVRAPLIAWWPQTIAAGSVETEPVAVWDIYPTVARIAGVPVPNDIDGVSILPLLNGQPQRVHDYIFLEGWTDETYTGTALAIRQGNLKLTRVRIGSDNESLALFDLDADPREERSLLHDDLTRDVANQLIAIMNTDRIDRDEDGLFPIPDERFLPNTPTLQGTAGSDTLFGDPGHDYILGLEGDDTINGTTGADRLSGNQGNDLIHGGKNSDLLRGGQGNDTLHGDLGDDILYGDLGDDILEDSAGSDDYHYLAGHGFDTIEDFAGRNELIFDDLPPSALQTTRQGDDLVIRISAPAGQVTIVNYYGSAAVWLFSPAIRVP